MYQMLQHSHSGLRYLVLLALIYAIYKAFTSKGSDYTESDRKTYLSGMILCHIQLLIGLGLYFSSPYVEFSSNTMKDSVLRFYSVEHISLMLIAIILITLGYMKGKKRETSAAKHKTTGRYYLIGLILILVSIPWPFRNLGAAWF